MKASHTSSTILISGLYRKRWDFSTRSLDIPRDMRLRPLFRAIRNAPSMQTALLVPTPNGRGMVDKNSFGVGSTYRGLAFVCQRERRAMLCGYPFQVDITGGGAALTCGEIAEGSFRATKTYCLPTHKVQNSMIPIEIGTFGRWDTVFHNRRTWW